MASSKGVPIDDRRMGYRRLIEEAADTNRRLTSSSITDESSQSREGPVWSRIDEQGDVVRARNASTLLKLQKFWPFRRERRSATDALRSRRVQQAEYGFAANAYRAQPAIIMHYKFGLTYKPDKLAQTSISSEKILRQGSRGSSNANHIMRIDGRLVPEEGKDADKKPDASYCPHTESERDVIALCDRFKMHEQERLAREMHDDFGQLLATMRMDLNHLASDQVALGPVAAASVANCLELVETMQRSVRHILSNVPPKEIVSLGLWRAIADLVDSYRKRLPVTFVCVLPNAPCTLTPPVQVSLFRMVQEALNNSVRHSGANTISVLGNCTESSINLQVIDDGHGLLKSEAGDHVSFGLRWMRERILALRGEIQIDSAPGTGTTIRVTVPLTGR